MTKPRSSLVSTDVTRYYHCITRCVRQAFLLQEGKTDRKKWLHDRLEEVASVYAVSVANYAILDNHFHLLLRLDVDIAQSWSDEEVVKRWARLHPPKKNRQPVDMDEEWLATELKDTKKIEKLRKRLCDLGWFMKEVKEPLARLCNREDGTLGTFFEGRFKSIAILDDEALIATGIYIDLNPFAAGLANTPEQSLHTSLYERIQHLTKLEHSEISLARIGQVITAKFPPDVEDYLWLTPIEDRRNSGAAREGMIESFTLNNYLLLLDEVARRERNGKASLSPAAAHILERLGFDPQFWIAQMNRDYTARLVGNFFASSKNKLKEVAKQLGLHHCWNLKEKPQPKPNSHLESSSP